MSSNSESPILPPKHSRARPASDTDSSDDIDTSIIARCRGTSRPVIRRRRNARRRSRAPSRAPEFQSVAPTRISGTEAAGTSRPARRITRFMRRASNPSSRPAEPKPSRRVAPYGTNQVDVAGTSRPAERSRRSTRRLSSPSSRLADSEVVEPKSRSKSPLKSAKSPKTARNDVAATSSKIGIEQKLDASNDQGEQCPICLIAFVNQTVASPCSCAHFFCYQCLVEWSKKTNTCPIDRKTFDVIDVRPKYGDKVERHIPVAARMNMDDDLSTLDEMDLDDEDEAGDELAVGFRGQSPMAGISRMFFPQHDLFSSQEDEDEEDLEFVAMPTSGGNFENMSPMTILEHLLSISSANEQSSSPSVRDEPSSPSPSLTGDEPSSPPSSPLRLLYDESPSSPLAQDEPSSPSMQSIPSSPVIQDEPSSPLTQDEPSSPSMQSIPSSPVIQDEPTPPSSPLVRDEPSSPLTVLSIGE